MMCCVCEGSCCHVGPHSYCAAHGGGAYVPAITAPSTNTPTYWPPTPQQLCNHCWCERSVYKVEHARCCKCGDEMHDAFIVRAESIDS